ncbi:hypothetical protein B0A54_06553 [Friedmanniomyces endolithicus]|uniref:Uncharacterized protein n=1 Tax=Friedmanniomyces endolithicus TaxID=329885 RepID=A0A4U0V220_9PEZI|nr:hypothetical protein B0A54_06553 [Friedmanniomyces endolithicus]
MRAVRYRDDDKAESTKATATKTSDSLKDTLKAFNYNWIYRKSYIRIYRKSYIRIYRKSYIRIYRKSYIS